MKLFDVYPLFDLEISRGEGCYVYDKNGTAYLDMYGGHAVISVGHSHPHYVERITEQVQQLGFYSNSVQNPLQAALAKKLGQLSGCRDYHLFLVNSGAEANENALKLASFHTGRTKVLAFENCFHGRTSAAVNVTDNPAIQAPINRGFDKRFLSWNDVVAVETYLQMNDVCAVIIEGIQGIGGVYVPDTKFLQELSRLCQKYKALLILDEIQSGYGRSGAFFAFQHAGIQPDLITVAKGMGNGFPIGGVLIHPKLKAKHGLLGTTFGGNHLACAAALAVLEIMETEKLMENAANTGAYLLGKLQQLPGIVEVRGRGLMTGVEMPFPIAELRKKLLFEYHIFTGSARQKNTLRLLPPLNIARETIDKFLTAFKAAMLSIKDTNDYATFPIG